jgi:hypothetical protein
MSGGWFWSSAGNACVRGEFVAEIGCDAEVRLVGAVAEDPRVTVEHTTTGETVTSVTGDPAVYVATSAPMDLHALLDSGEPVSLLSAQNNGLFTPRYVARAAIFGAHVSHDKLYSAIRFRIDTPYWTAHLADGETHAVPDDGSILRAAAPDEGNDMGMWLVYESAHPRSRRDLDSRVLAACLALARIALDRPLVVRTVQVRTSQYDRWLPLHSKALGTPVSEQRQSLLPRRELTIERFANWIALNYRLDGLASTVYELGGGTVQTQVLVSTSIVEGLHRRLPYEQSEFPMASGGACERVKRAARDAAVCQALVEKEMDHDRIRKTVVDAVCHFEDVSYRTRAQEIIDEVASVVPELVESVPDLAGKLVTARNDIAHHLVLSDGREPIDTRIDRWLVVSYVTPGLLRLLLLIHAGIEPDALRAACLTYDRFGSSARILLLSPAIGHNTMPRPQELPKGHYKLRLSIIAKSSRRQYLGVDFLPRCACCVLFLTSHQTPGQASVSAQIPRQKSNRRRRSRSVRRTRCT